MRRALGKGLSQLIGEQFDNAPSEAPINSIEANRWQPRSVFDDDALHELAASIKEVGVLQPLVVRSLAEGRYELIAGERRLRASKLAGLQSVPIIIRSTTDQNALEIALIENIQREDIGAMECARAYRRLASEFSLTQDQISQKVGKARTSVANTMRLLKLPTKIQDGVETGQISEGHARALLQIEHEDHQLAVFDFIIKKGLNVREVEKIAARKPRAPRIVRPPEQPAEWAPIEEALSAYLGSPVRLTKAEVGGKITIDFYSDDDLDRILETLGFRLDQ